MAPARARLPRAETERVYGESYAQVSSHDCFVVACFCLFVSICAFSLALHACEEVPMSTVPASDLPWVQPELHDERFSFVVVVVVARFCC